MSVPLSDTRLTDALAEVDALKTQLGDWIATVEQHKNDATRARVLLQRGNTDQAASLLFRMAGGEHELPQRESLLAEVERLRAELASTRSDAFREAARVIETLGHSDDAVAVLDNIASGITEYAAPSA